MMTPTLHRNTITDKAPASSAIFLEVVMAHVVPVLAYELMSPEVYYTPLELQCSCVECSLFPRISIIFVKLNIAAGRYPYGLLYSGGIQSPCNKTEHRGLGRLSA